MDYSAGYWYETPSGPRYRTSIRCYRLTSLLGLAAVVIAMFKSTDIAYLWYNLIECLGVIIFGFLFSFFGSKK